MSQFEVGTEVYLFGPTVPRNTKHRVAKVHKSGRLVVEGLTGQWRPAEVGNGVAHETGKTSYRRYLRVATPEVEAELAEKQAQGVRWTEFIRLEERLTQFERDVRNKRREGPTEEFLQLLRAALDTQDLITGAGRRIVE